MLYSLSYTELLSAAAIGAVLTLSFGSGFVGSKEIPVASAVISQQSVSSEVADHRSVKPRIPIEVLRVIDGDTVEVRAQIWLDQHITTKVRIRSIDAPELQSRCAKEQELARASRDHLVSLFGNKRGYMTDLGHDKFGSRVLASLSNREGKDIAALMLGLGYARPYQGGRRQSWC